MQKRLKARRSPIPSLDIPLYFKYTCTSQQILDTNHKKIYNQNLSFIQLHFYNATRDTE